MPRSYPEKRIDLKEGEVPPHVYICDCGNELKCPEYNCDRCKKQIAFYVPMGFVDLK